MVNIRNSCILLILKHWYKQSLLRADFDAMTSCSVLFSSLKGDVTGAGSDVKRHCPSPYGEMFNRFSSVLYVFDCGCQMQRICLRVAASYVMGIEYGGGDWLAWQGGKTGGWRWTAFALRPTCCLSNALIRVRCEWTWHCDIKEFHSQHVSSSPYGINMLLMFLSDTGLFSPITNGSDKHTDNDMIVIGISLLI